MKKDNMRIVATVMGEPDSNTRNSEVSSMLDYAFAQVSLKQILTKNSIVKLLTSPIDKPDKQATMAKNNVILNVFIIY